MSRFSFILFLFTICAACNSEKTTDEKAHQIVTSCIEAHGGSHYKDFDIAFDFRKFRVHLKQRGSEFTYKRETKDSLGNVIEDVLTNTTFVRNLNGKPQALSEKDMDKYREGTNSIAYFVLLPFKLSEPAVILSYLGETTFEGKKYDKVKVTFQKEGGGKDHEDEFCYWINQSSHTLDYLSYANGGPRLRKATKRNTVGGIVFQDYENYEILDKSLSTAEYDKAFTDGKAKLLSTIEQSNYISNQ